MSEERQQLEFVAKFNRQPICLREAIDLALFRELNPEDYQEYGVYELQQSTVIRIASSLAVSRVLECRVKDCNAGCNLYLKKNEDRTEIKPISNSSKSLDDCTRP